MVGWLPTSALTIGELVAQPLPRLQAPVNPANRLVCMLVALILAIGAALTMASIAQAQSISKDGPVLLAKGGGGGGGGGGAGGGGGSGGSGVGPSGGGDGASTSATASPTRGLDVVVAKAQQDLARGD